jgi:RimJ/RimL family protein N-acetyltransferase
MTDVVKKICEIGFTEFNLSRIEAAVFSTNNASKKVLEKNFFSYEGTLRKFYLKNEIPVDVDIYVRIL